MVRKVKLEFYMKSEQGCVGCPCFNGFDGVCQAELRELNSLNICSERPDWCKLVEIPDDSLSDFEFSFTAVKDGKLINGEYQRKASVTNLDVFKEGLELAMNEIKQEYNCDFVFISGMKYLGRS